MENNNNLLKVWLWLAVIAAGLLILRLMLPALVFMPISTLARTPEAAGLPFEDIELTASDGIQLHGWYIPAPNARSTLLFFHGNAGNISHRLDSIKIFHDLGLSVFIIDYRGYGQSEGSPSIKGTRLDALAAWQWLTEDKKIPAEKIILFGRSLGGAIAVELARSVTPGALILESTFSSLAEMAPFIIPTPVARLIIWDAWNSTKTAAGITVPTLCIHSQADEVVPYRQGRRLYDAVAGEKVFVDIRGGHNDGFMRAYDIYVAALDDFLTKHFGGY
jgi:fermentation-respiration switch protein FrsA (DUF1100 family)